MTGPLNLMQFLPWHTCLNIEASPRPNIIDNMICPIGVCINRLIFIVRVPLLYIRRTNKGKGKGNQGSPWTPPLREPRLSAEGATLPLWGSQPLMIPPLNITKVSLLILIWGNIVPVVWGSRGVSIRRMRRLHRRCKTGALASENWFSLRLSFSFAKYYQQLKCPNRTI